MHRLRIYLDTSVISLLFQDEAGERQEVSRDLFDNVVAPRIHDVSISAVVLEEINRTPDSKRREAMLNIVSTHQIPFLAFDPADEALLRLAKLYVELGIIPPGKRRDALHVAVATIHEVDMLATWNYKHLAGVKRASRWPMFRPDLPSPFALLRRWRSPTHEKLRRSRHGRTVDHQGTVLA